ncbi:MAG: LON peptidase substrate-binding domain-containing protein [Chloroflexota bacterium]|nr:LON peptidase substrate-binding domain-containing protein [Chloroflexota bacterium]
MSANAIELPLFPLNVVLFPGMIIPLHIFEPRYRQMITDCDQQKSPFGMVLARPTSIPLWEEPYLVGTMAEIQQLERLEDGRFTLIAFGLQRFRILSQHRKKSYLSGWVELYTDRLEASQDLGVYTRQTGNLFRKYLGMLLEMAKEKQVLAEIPSEPEELSHFVAQFLDIQDEQKQQLLELTSTQQRLKEEIAVLRREVLFIQQIFSRRTGDEDHSKLN